MLSQSFSTFFCSIKHALFWCLSTPFTVVREHSFPLSYLNSKGIDLQTVFPISSVNVSSRNKKKKQYLALYCFVCPETILCGCLLKLILNQILLYRIRSIKLDRLPLPPISLSLSSLFKSRYLSFCCCSLARFLSDVFSCRWSVHRDCQCTGLPGNDWSF